MKSDLFPHVARASSSGAWELNSSMAWPYGHVTDSSFAFALSLFLAKEQMHAKRHGATTLLDIGAGVGEYGAWFHGCLASTKRVDWTGVDGSNGVETLSGAGPAGARVQQVDLCGGADIPVGKHDWAMSLEVGEHLPQSCLATFLRTLDQSNRNGLILSWGHLNQPGIGHISPRASRDVASALRFLGYYEDHNASATLQVASELRWLAQNLRVYRRFHQAIPDTRLPIAMEAQRDREVVELKVHGSIFRLGPCHPRTLKNACSKRPIAEICACMYSRHAVCHDPSTLPLWRRVNVVAKP